MSNGRIANNPAALKRLRRRYREEGRFRGYGIAAIVFAIASLAVLLVSIVGESISAFSKHELEIELTLDPAVIDPSGRRDPEVLTKNVSAFSDLVRDELKHRFPEAADDMALRRQLSRIVSTLAGSDLAKRAAANPQLIGQKTRIDVPVSDLIDLYLKGLITAERVMRGAAPADVSRSGQTVTVRSAGGFAQAYDDMVERLTAEAKGKTDAAEASQVSIDHVNTRIADLNARRAELAAADAAKVRADAETYAEQGKADDVALIREAGVLSFSGELGKMQAVVKQRLEAAAAVADGEANELLVKGASYAQKAADAEKNGEPVAETRRIQAQTAYLAGDRRRVDAALLRDRAQATSSMGSAELIASVSLLTGRPLAPVAQLTAADSAGAKTAVMAVNTAEIAAADVAVADQEARIARLAREAASLKASAPDRAKAVEETALPAAKSRLARLEREREARREMGGRLSGLTPLPDSAAPGAPAQPGQAPGSAPAPGVDDASLVTTERAAQLGLDLGGPLAAAFALGQADAKAPTADANLKALMLAHADLDIEAARRDVERLTRKRDRDTEAANAVLAQTRQPGAAIAPDEFSPSLLVEINGGVVKAARVTPDAIEGAELIPLKGDARADAWQVRELKVAEADRLVTDRQAAWANALKASGEIKRVINFDLITKADSTYPELAGLAAALAGSFWIMLVTLVLSLPIGVAAAIYLEEFAPRNSLTDFIEVNINNLAAVPSIVFGLLGAAVFINFFDLPRSAPLVGGLVLSLITLPTIIIATRAALGAVPPSIREGALAVGASLPQTVFHHVLPLAAPGILTGAIIGLARALGETAPLLLIGMVAFVADPPDNMMDSATALPVLVYKWSSAAERAWQPMTSAAIIVLLVFMFAMNAIAVYLRRRLERRW
jgi:phosphate ABC transporter permease subunit PstA